MLFSESNIDSISEISASLQVSSNDIPISPFSKYLKLIFKDSDLFLIDSIDFSLGLIRIVSKN